MFLPTPSVVIVLVVVLSSLLTGGLVTVVILARSTADAAQRAYVQLYLPASAEGARSSIEEVVLSSPENPMPLDHPTTPDEADRQLHGLIDDGAIPSCRGEADQSLLSLLPGPM